MATASTGAAVLEAERAILGSGLLGDGEAVRAVRPDELSRDGHRAILEAMRRLHDRGAGIDPTTLAAELGEDLERAGGALYLSQLMDGLPRAPNVPEYARIVQEAAAHRELASLGQQLTADALKGEDTTELVARISAISAGASRNGRGRRAVELQPASSITPRPITYLWAGRVVAGDLNLLAGAPGVGKGTITMYVAARVSRGDLEGGLRGSPASVVIASAEDSPEAVIKPRLMAAGAELDNVAVVRVKDADGDDDGLVLPDDVALLTERVRAAGAALVIIDPVAAHLSGAVDSHKDASIRKALAPLSRLAQSTGAAVLAVAHLNKAHGGDWVRRIGGSVGLGAAARNVLLAGDAPDGAERVLVHAKSNTGELAKALRYRVEGIVVTAGELELPTCRAALLGELEGVSAAEMLDPPEPGERSATEEAAAWLRAYLEDEDGEAIAEDCMKAARRNLPHISKRTLQLARKAAGISTTKSGGPGRPWVWRLADAEGEHKGARPTNTRSLCTFAPYGESAATGASTDPKGAKAQGAGVAEAGAPLEGDGDSAAGADDDVELEEEAPRLWRGFEI